MFEGAGGGGGWVSVGVRQLNFACLGVGGWGGEVADVGLYGVKRKV